MKLGNWTGRRGIPYQDIAMWETMGPIADRGDERLGASDQAIVQFRRIMLDAVNRFRDGQPPIGTQAISKLPQSSIRSFEGMLLKGAEWRHFDTVDAQAKSSSAEAAPVREVERA